MSAECVFEYFQEICKIPRVSYEEEKIADYLEQQGKYMNLEVYRDQENNVILKRQGSRPDSPKVILQAHTDMVWETEEQPWTEEKIPRDISVKEGVMRTRGTTLGADDGIGMALILALLKEKEEDFPAIEAVFTSNEEETMGGAMALRKKDLSGTFMINLDSEEEGVFTIGAAGGISAACTIPLKKNPAQYQNGLCFSITGASCIIQI